MNQIIMFPGSTVPRKSVQDAAYEDFCRARHIAADAFRLWLLTAPSPDDVANEVTATTNQIIALQALLATEAST